MSLPEVTPRVEWKVKAATAGSYIGGVLALALLQIASDGAVTALVRSALPPSVALFVLPLLPTAITFATAWITRHTPRESGISDVVDDRIEALAETLGDNLRGELTEAIDARLPVDNEIARNTVRTPSPRQR